MLAQESRELVRKPVGHSGGVAHRAGHGRVGQMHGRRNRPACVQFATRRAAHGFAAYGRRVIRLDGRAAAAVIPIRIPSRECSTRPQSSEVNPWRIGQKFHRQL